MADLSFGALSLDGRTKAAGLPCELSRCQKCRLAYIGRLFFHMHDHLHFERWPVRSDA
jgi:hypothetical protein